MAASRFVRRLPLLSSAFPCPAPRFGLALPRPIHSHSHSHSHCLFLRPFSSASSEGDFDLLKSLRAEIQHEGEVGSLQDLQSPPEPFELVDKPNVQEVFLHRSFGVEDIEISCVYHNQTYGEDDEEDGFDPPDPNVPMKMVQMTIKISIGSDKPFLEIVCCTFGEKSTIERVLLKDHIVNLKEAPYEGPDILKLNDKVKSGFLQYLTARGIDDRLGKFLLNFMPHKAQQEYSRWLKKIEGFVKI